MPPPIFNTINRFLPPWVALHGKDDDVALSSRVRIARNFADFRFPARASEDERTAIYKLAAKIIAQQMGADLSLHSEMNDLTAMEKGFLAERRLLSRELCSRGKGSGILVRQDQRLSVMINEEDHLRFQAMHPGFNIRGPQIEVDRAIQRVESEKKIAFDPALGFLTACPTNVGTGLRVSVMLHLPGLFFLEQTDSILRGTHELGMTMRGLFGEGTEPLGHLFQISNQSTLGESEAAIYRRVERIVAQLIQAERSARQNMLFKHKARLADYVGRAYGNLRYAWSINARQALDYLFAVRLGVALGFFSNSNLEIIHELIQHVQPVHLQLALGEDLECTMRDQARAVLIRNKIGYIEKGTNEV